MPRTLYLTTQLPYFPGQGGFMALQVRHLAKVQLTGVLGPRYPDQPEDALQRLRDTVQRSYWWPEYPVPGGYLITPVQVPSVKWLKHLPNGIKHRLWRRLTGLDRYSNDALAWRAVLANLAPKLLEAIREERWNVLLLSQSTSASWFPFLPASLARCLYFHDVRSDYLRRSPLAQSRNNLHRILTEERAAAQDVDAIAMVSALDETRAAKLLDSMAPTAVAPLCLDLDYFSFDHVQNRPPVVLFTGHLSHPPNVDAVQYFLASIWPQILTNVPQAKFQIVGLQPASGVVEAVARATQVELIPNVPDIRPYYHNAAVYVVPMRYGGGVRQKILESWAVGLPVVTTTMGAEGVAVTDAGNCWLRDTPSEFANQVNALLRAPAPAALLQSARSFVEIHHSPEAACPALSGQINVAVKRRQQSAPRILYDLRWLKPGKAGGVEQMTYELLNEIASYDRTYEYRFFGSREVCGNLKFPSAFKQRTFQSDGKDARWFGWRNAAIQQLTSDLALPSVMNPELSALEWYARLDFSVVHGLPSLLKDDFRQFPSVVTMHDLQHLHLPEYFTPEDIATREREYRESCRRATHIICTSEFTRQDVCQRYGVPLEKMTTIWNLPPRLASSAISQATIQRLLRGMGIKPPFLFYPAQPWLHKNHRGLLEALSLTHGSLPKDCKLVLTGQPFPPDHPAAKLMLSTGIRERVVHLGYRSPLEIAALFRTAEALIFPSLFEGFGIPLVEAMLQGCPIVCGQHTCIPEIVNNAALFTDVSSPDALASAILSISRDTDLRAKLRQNATVNVRRFDRRTLAEKTRTIYASVHEHHFE